MHDDPLPPEPPPLLTGVIELAKSLDPPCPGTEIIVSIAPWPGVIETGGVSARAAPVGPAIASKTATGSAWRFCTIPLAGK